MLAYLLSAVGGFLVASGLKRSSTQSFAGGGKIIQYPDGFKFKEVSKKYAADNWREKEIYGLDLYSHSEALIESSEDLERFEVFGVEYAGGGGVNDGKKFAGGGFITDIDKAFGSTELKQRARKKMKKGDAVVAFAYTDYGGDFFDKVAIEFFQKNYPRNTVVEEAIYNGKNAIVFGKPAKEFLEESEKYLLGFDDIENYYYERVSEEEYEEFDNFLKNIEKYDDYTVKEGALEWLMENKSGHYSMTPQGLDYSDSDLIDILEEEGLIEKKDDEMMYARGGGVSDDVSEILKTGLYKKLPIKQGDDVHIVFKKNMVLDGYYHIQDESDYENDDDDDVVGADVRDVFPVMRQENFKLTDTAYISKTPHEIKVKKGVVNNDFFLEDYSDNYLLLIYLTDYSQSYVLVHKSDIQELDFRISQLRKKVRKNTGFQRGWYDSQNKFRYNKTVMAASGNLPMN